MTKTSAKKYYSAITNSKRRHLTCEALSSSLGIYPEIIARDLSEFEPMLAMDPSIDLRSILPALQEVINEQSKEKKEPRIVVKKSEISKYKSIPEFIYEKMTYGGLVDKNAELTEKDLRVLQKLVNDELAQLKKKSKK